MDAIAIDTAIWIAILAAAGGMEATGLLGFHGMRPLTTITRGEMQRSELFTTGVVAFVLWLAWHFAIETYLPAAHL